MDKVPEENIVVFSFPLENSGAESFLKEVLSKGFTKDSLLGKQFHVIPEFAAKGDHSIMIRCHKNDEALLKKYLKCSILNLIWVLILKL